MTVSSPGTQQSGEGSSSSTGVVHRDEAYHTEQANNRGIESTLLAEDTIEDNLQAQ